jgi:glycerol kinase
MTKLVLAIDQSTSGTNAILFTVGGAIIDQVSISHQQLYPQPGWVEHDAEEIYRNTCQVVSELVQRNSDRQTDVLCLSITNQRETIVIFDKASGTPLYHAIVWQCRRGEARCDELLRAGLGERVRQITGLKIDTYFPASKLQWVFTNHPDIYQQVKAGKALIGTIDTYLIYRLTRGQVFATDYTNASRTLLFDINRLEWSEELCQIFDVPTQALAEPRANTAQFGETDVESTLVTPLPIIGVMGDSQAALFAQRCFIPGGAKVTFGTGSSVLLNIGSTPRLDTNGSVSTIAWVENDQPIYALEGIINATGATIAWLQNQLGLITSPQETETLAQSVADNGGVYLVPAFIGLSAPYWRPDVKAAIVGLTTASTKQHVVRAALESIAYQIRDALDLMSQEANVQLQLLHADGGMVANHFLMQFTANITGCTVRASNLPELSALGSVFSGLRGIGIYPSLQVLTELPQEFIDYEPQLTHQQVESLYAGWKAAVQRVL